MRFEISLLYILFVRASWAQENNPLQCLSQSLHSGLRDPDNVTDTLFILQTPSPIGNSWEAVVVNLRSDDNEDIKKIEFNFDTSVEVYIESDGTRTQLPYIRFEDNAADDPIEQILKIKLGYYEHVKMRKFVYKPDGVKIFKILVRNVFNNTTPYLKSMELNSIPFNICERLTTIPWEMIHLYKTSVKGLPYLITDTEQNFQNKDKDLISYIKDVYSTKINSQHTHPAQKISCGRVKTHSALITNASPTNPGDWPWHAALFHATDTGTEYKCGGSLITANAILTAAHCVHEGDRLLIRNRIVIKLGLFKIVGAASNAQEFDVYRVIPHENFDAISLKNDIALLQLTTEPKLSDYVQPVCLWFRDKVSIGESVGKVGYVIGWGKNEKQENVEYLSAGRMPVISYEDCLDRHNEFYARFLSTNTFCAGFRNGTSVCNGDSGGGMFFKDDNGIFRIRGIVSLSMALEHNACNPYEYVIFTNVGRYLNWIEKTIADKF